MSTLITLKLTFTSPMYRFYSNIYIYVLKILRQTFVGQFEVEVFQNNYMNEGEKSKTSFSGLVIIIYIQRNEQHSSEHAQ